MDDFLPKQEGTVYEYGFGRNLSRVFPNRSTGLVYDYINRSQNAGQVLSGGNLSLKTLQIGSLVRQVAPTDDIQAAIDAVSREGGGTVQLLAGEYKLRRLVQMREKVVLAGAGRDVTVLDFGNGAFHIFATGTAASPVQNFQIRDLSVRRSNKTAAIDLTLCRAFSLVNVRAVINDQKGFRTTSCENWLMFNCVAEDNTGNGFEFVGDAASVTNALFTLLNCSSVQNGGVGFRINDTALADVAAFRLVGCDAIENTSHGFHIGNATTAQLLATFSDCVSRDNTGKGFASDAQAVNFLGCSATFNGDDGFEVLQLSNSIIGSNSNQNTGTDYDIQNSCVLMGNVTRFSPTTNPANRYSDNDTNLPQHSGNIGLTFKQKKEAFRMKNNTGVTIRQGCVVVQGTDADAMEVTTTTTNGDNRVFGMANENLLSSGTSLYGSVLTKGWTSLLFVNNSAASIAVGDYLSAYSHAYYAKKAVAGDTIFAIALEAPSTGTAQIDACLIAPRLI